MAEDAALQSRPGSEGTERVTRRRKQDRHPDEAQIVEDIISSSEAMKPEKKAPPLEQQLAWIREAAISMAPSEEKAEEFVAHIEPWVVIHDDYVHSPESRAATDQDAVRLHRLGGDLQQIPKLLRRIDESRSELATSSRSLRDILRRVNNDIDDIWTVGYVAISQQEPFDSEAFNFWKIALESVVLPSASAAAQTVRDPRRSRRLREPSLALLVASIAAASEAHLGLKPRRSPNSHFIHLLQDILLATGMERCSRTTCRDILDAVIPDLRQPKE